MVDRGIWYRRGCPKRSWRYCTATLGVRQQIQRVGGRLLVSEVKTERSRRMIPLPPIALVALKARRLEQARIKLASHNAWPSDLILTTKHGTPVEPRNLARSFDRLCRAGSCDPSTRHAPHVRIAPCDHRRLAEDDHGDSRTQSDCRNDERLHPRDHRGTAPSCRPSRQAPHR